MTILPFTWRPAWSSTAVRIYSIGKLAAMGTRSWPVAIRRASFSRVFLDVALNVQASPDAGPLAGAGVAFTGAASGEMTCLPAGIGPGAVCRWPAGPVMGGSYALQVAAPGYQSADTPA